MFGKRINSNYWETIRPVVLVVVIRCIYLFAVFFMPKYTEFGLTSTILCIKFTVFLCSFEHSPDKIKKTQNSKIKRHDNDGILFRGYC